MGGLCSAPANDGAGLAPLTVHHSTIQGRRNSQEDRLVVLPRLAARRCVGYFAVFDGHNGQFAAQFCSRYLHKALQGALRPDGSISDANLVKAFLTVDADCLRESPSPPEDSGATAAVVLLNRRDGRLTVANCGDTRVVLSRDGVAVQLSVDHTPALEEERKRVESAGHYIQHNRLDGLIAVTRSFGDLSFKSSEAPPRGSESFTRNEMVHRRKAIEGTLRHPERQALTVLPHLTHLDVDPERDEFVVVACDGIFDTMDNQTVVSFVRSQVAPHLGDEHAQRAAALARTHAPAGQAAAPAPAPAPSEATAVTAPPAPAAPGVIELQHSSGAAAAAGDEKTREQALPPPAAAPPPPAAPPEAEAARATSSHMQAISVPVQRGFSNSELQGHISQINSQVSINDVGRDSSARCRGSRAGDLVSFGVAKLLCERSIALGSADNCTAIVIFLSDKLFQRPNAVGDAGRPSPSGGAAPAASDPPLLNGVAQPSSAPSSTLAPPLAVGAGLAAAGADAGAGAGARTRQISESAGDASFSPRASDMGPVNLMSEEEDGYSS